MIVEVSYCYDPKGPYGNVTDIGTVSFVGKVVTSGLRMLSWPMFYEKSHVGERPVNLQSDPTLPTANEGSCFTIGVGDAAWRWRKFY